ncbi:MAG: 3-deoxy-manno-octulosonate cytidylyltransferase [Neisseria sp.]|jgi:3-deoxy-manno-octulosonate cytidylyltransferase (CMP-KDO synthetase)|uniref:3-deoxy-manno-octulosonate cytidylyltransferase n=1 Tax=Uruburuella suis TaxID=252130 RepID=UPI001B4B7E46|nr:3-deoxy-manno-octulosonate cytidylyltransferase [Neisseria sp.]MBP8043081.1 3-deoxy-manno-octulosonate cytidylyltransferase [Neisseria sp.]MBP8045842.1 3-deoxy-manno-octulosonate cytidylyltransferase [Neisseria sp.]MBP8069883.1 3-deoxy-manno-octulosonate cytidylyltransferase [Neisseria sp.]MBP8874766.1 3-deoxy-manno-octulosonate cytidylyltransferase [Neisseria sp.]
MSGFVVLIPARMSSSRLPRKALADIHGKPMVVRAAEQAAKSRAGRVVVATDHEEIFAACQAHNIEVVMTGEYHESGTTRLAEAAQLLGLSADTVVVNVQGDEPLIDPKLVDQTAAVLVENGAPMATAAHEIHDFDEFMNPNVVKVVLCRQGRALYFSRAPIAYPRDSMRAGERTLPQADAPLRHIGIYAYRAGFLNEYAQMSASPLENIESLEQLRVLWHGHPIAVEIVAQAPAAGVDTQEDLERVRAVFQKAAQ